MKCKICELSGADYYGEICPVCKPIYEKGLVYEEILCGHNGDKKFSWDIEHDSLSWHATHRPETVAFIGGLIK